MTAEKYVQNIRKQQRQKFGDVGVKKDCEHYVMENRKDWCIVCTHDRDRGCLPCECGVCYFYKQKEEK